MNIEEAEEIIKKYGGVLGTGLPDEVARQKSRLPFSKGRIKQAYFNIIEYLIKNDDFDDDKASLLRSTFIGIDVFIDDEKAKEINAFHKKFSANNTEVANLRTTDSYTEYLKFIGTKVGNSEALEEISDFIDDCYLKFK